MGCIVFLGTSTKYILIRLHNCVILVINIDRIFAIFIIVRLRKYKCIGSGIHRLRGTASIIIIIQMNITLAH